MQNAYVLERMARIQIQERLNEAKAERLAAASATARNPSILDRLAAALSDAFEADPVSDLAFGPKLTDYPTH